MKGWVFVTIAFAILPRSSVAQPNCLDPTELGRLDAGWEQALLTGDVAWLEMHLADDFIWVHNHATAIDTKADILQATSGSQSGSSLTRSRVQSDVETRVLASTGLVTGFTVVDRGPPSPTRYNFMRTYALREGRCLLLGNHTMEVPHSDQGSGAGS